MENLFFLPISVHGGGDGGGLLQWVDAGLEWAEQLLSLPGNQVLPNLFPGLAALPNIHPLFVHFPIVLLSLFLAAEVVALIRNSEIWRRLAAYLLYAGAVFAGLTVAAGLQAAAGVPHGAETHQIMETHEHLAISVFGLAALLSAWRGFARFTLHGAGAYIFLLAAALLNLLLLLTADLGGLMVYKFGVGVQAVSEHPSASMAGHVHGE